MNFDFGMVIFVKTSFILSINMIYLSIDIVFKSEYIENIKLKEKPLQIPVIWYIIIY